MGRKSKKTLIICDGRLDDALTGGFRKQRGRLADGSRLLVNGAVAALAAIMTLTGAGCVLVRVRSAKHADGWHVND